MPALSLKDLMNLPIDTPSAQPIASTTPSSPPPLSPEHFPFGADSTGVPSSPPSSSIARTSRKQPIQEMTQFAGEISRTLKLPKADRDELERFSKSDPNEQRIWIAGNLLKISRQQDLLQPPDAIYVVPKKLERKIDELVHLILLNPAIALYVHNKSGPTKLLTDELEKNPSWGLTKELKADNMKYNVIVTLVRKKLTNRRNEMKKVIQTSIGTQDPSDDAGSRRIDAFNIVELCEALISLNQKVSVTLDVAMCGRVAFLRQVCVENNTPKYWEVVDSELEAARAKHPDPVKFSGFIGLLLEMDRKHYGNVNLDSISTSRPVHTRDHVDGDDDA